MQNSSDPRGSSTFAEDTSTTQKPRRSGIGAVVDEDFSVSEAIGGVRGAIESVLPGLAFVLVFVITRNLGLTVAISGAIAVISVVVRLFEHQQIRSALTGVASIAICLVWAWMSHDAKNFYLPGFLTNIVWVVLLLISVIVRIPGIGVVVEFIHTPLNEGFSKWLAAWRADTELVRAYTITSWLWIAMFAARLLVQVPLYLVNSVGFLGTARLVMGVPLFALIIWISWVLISPALRRVDAQRAENISESVTVDMTDAGEETHE